MHTDATSASFSPNLKLENSIPLAAFSQPRKKKRHSTKDAETIVLTTPKFFGPVFDILIRKG